MQRFYLTFQLSITSDGDLITPNTSMLMPFYFTYVDPIKVTIYVSWLHELG